MTKDRKPTAKKMGRPSKRTPEVVNRVIEGLNNGTPLAALCREDGMPAARTIYDWMDGDEELSAAIARARDVGYDVISTDILDIIDNTEEDPASRRVRADFRLKLLSKWDPKRYGDKLELGGKDGGPMTLEIIKFADSKE